MPHPFDDDNLFDSEFFICFDLNFSGLFECLLFYERNLVVIRREE